MHQKHWTFKQEVAASTWNINNVPEGANGAVITHIISDGGLILQPDNQLISPDGLQISFGVEAVAGTAYGDYYIEDASDDHTVISGDGGIVNITVHQNNGNSHSQ